jgi:hypothetical protein
MKWHDLHVDDVVLGADGAEYLVTARTGMTFELRRTDGWEVRCSPPPDTHVPLVRRSDHKNEAAAFDAFISAGFTIEILGERRP